MNSQNFQHRRQNQRHNTFRSNKNQQVYVPKPKTDESHNNSLTQSLRKDNRNGKSAIEGRFVRYLPQDDALAEGLGVQEGGLDPKDTQEVADLLNSELSALLRMKPRQFWKTVSTDASLHEFLDSYLQYKRRWFDLPYRGQTGSIAGVVIGDSDLSRRVFMVLYRISSNHDPGAAPNESFSTKEHADLLLSSRLLDIPKLMDICALFGNHNAGLTATLVSNAIKSQPGIIDELKNVVPSFLDVVDTMHQRCIVAVEAFPTTGENQKSKAGHLHEDLMEVLNFVNDAVVTLDAFVEAFPMAAAYFVAPAVEKDDTKELIPELGIMHDSLIPLLYQGFTFTSVTLFHSSSDNESHFLNCLNIVKQRLVKFAWQLLSICYLSESLVQNNLNNVNLEVFPAQVQDPVVRGEIISQSIIHIATKISGVMNGTIDNESFLYNLERRHNIMSKIPALCKTGWCSLDDFQLNYISELFGHSVSRSSSVANMTADSGSTLLQDYENSDEQVMMLSKISQIKDILPDYGVGFLSACLDVYNNNAEEVIQRILEGTLHPDLQSLDISLESKPCKNQPSLGNKDKGKGKLTESVVISEDKDRPVVSYLESSNSASNAKKLSSLEEAQSRPTGRFVRRPKEDVIAMDILDQQEVKKSFQSVVLASQYEDEYDDSFDELGVSFADLQVGDEESLEDDQVTSRKNLPVNKPSVQNSVKAQHEKMVSEVPSGMKSSPSPYKSSRNETFSKGKQKNYQKPQFYVKDGKNYSYKVAGAVPVADANEAEAMKKAQEETIYGLGPGGNIPLQTAETSNEASDERHDNFKRGGSDKGMRGRGVHGRGGHYSKNNHHRKDRALKKHFGSLGGY